MDLTSYIAGISMNMKAAQLQQQVDISVLKKAMETKEASADALLEMVSMDPALGRNVDVRV